ncbi:MAG: shikimate dehydrogenase [Bacteroidales bacterium]
MDIYGLTGKQIKHSFSPEYFNNKFKKEGIHADYRLFPLESIREIKRLVRETNNLKGLNVTIPYKQQILAYLDDRDRIVERTGAANTISIDAVGSRMVMKGYNTDVPAFASSLLNFIPGTNMRALVLGSGGASHAVCHVLKDLHMEYRVVSRQAPGNSPALSYGDLSEALLQKYRLIINTTPLGMTPKPRTYPDIPYRFLSPEHYLFDLVYNPPLTVFLEKGIHNGAKTKNGLEMLKLQAERSWEIWKSR